MNKLLIQTIAVASLAVTPVVGTCTILEGSKSETEALIVENLQEKSEDSFGINGITIVAKSDGSNPRFVYLRREVKFDKNGKKTETDYTDKLVKYRYLLPRDKKFTIENDLDGYRLFVTEDFKEEGAEEKEIESKGRRSISASDQLIQIQIRKDDKIVDSIVVELMAAKKLEILTTVGMGATFAPREPESYRLAVDPSIMAGTNTRITRSDSKSFSANINGQIYAPFDDEAFFGGFGLILAKVMTLGMFNREHHRLGLMAGLATNGADEPSYQIGYMWSLDRDAKMVISIGWMFRQRQDLLFGLSEGDIFDGEIPARKTWKSSPFIGISFNLGT